MRLLLLFLLAPLLLTAQRKNNGDTVRMRQYGFSTQYTQELIPANWGSIPSSQRIAVIFFHGQGEKGNGATDTARIYAAGLPKMIRSVSSWTPPNTFIFSPQLNSGANFWTREARNAILNYIKTTYGISAFKIHGEGYSLGATGLNNFIYDKASDWASALSVAGAQGNQDDFVISGDSIKKVPTIVSYNTGDVTQSISNGIKALDSTLVNNANGPTLLETDFYYSGSHSTIDDTVWNKYGQYLRWHLLHDTRYDTTVALHVDSLEKGFDDHFFRKTARLVDSLPAGSLKTSLSARVTAAADRAYGVNWQEYGVTTSPPQTNWKQLVNNANGQAATALIDNRTGTASGISLTIISTGGSTQKRTYTNNYDQYNGLPSGAMQRPHEVFSRTATTTYRYSSMPSGIYYVVIDGTSETTPGSYESGLSVTVNGVTKTLRLQWRNTSRYLFFGPVTVTGGTLDIAMQGYVASGVGHVSALRLIKQGTSGSGNLPPFVDAGTDKVVTLPATTTTITGTASDVDGSVTGVLWTKQSGPSGGAITSPTSLSTGLTGLQQTLPGTPYVYRLTATDNSGATAYDEVTVTVDATIKGTAGADYWIPMQQARPQLPITVTFTDTAGVSTGWTWTKLAGGGTLSNANQRTATVTGITQGYNTFKVVATASGGLTATDTITINLRDLQNGRGRELPCRSGTKQWFKVGNVVGGGTNTVSFSMQYVKRDNLIPGLMGGDTIMLVRNPNNNGIWNRVTFGDIEAPDGCPIVIVPDTSGTGIVTLSDTAVNNTAAFYLASHDSNAVKNLKVLGTYNYAKKGVAYGFQIGNPTTSNAKYYYRGVTGNYLNNLWLSGIALFNCSTGFSLKTISDSAKVFKLYDHYRNTIYIEDFYIDSNVNEALYIGTTDRMGLGQGNDGPPPKGNYISMNRGIIRSTGWDGPQVSYFEGSSMKNMVVLSTGNANSPGQIASMLSGGSVGASIIDSNFIRRQVGGPTILGEGKTSFRNNIVWDFQQMYISQARDVGVAFYNALQVFVENNYYFGQTGSSYGVTVANSGGETFLPGSFRYNTIATTKTIGQFYNSVYGDTVAGNVIRAPLSDPITLLDTSRLKDMPAYLMYKFIAANPSNRTPSFYDIYAPVAPPEPNQPPVVSITPVAPSSASSRQLFATVSDADGTATVLWTQTAGTSATITGATTTTPTITGLTPGSRTFRLRATDDDGAVTDAFITVVTTDNLPPVIASITPSQTILGTTATLTVVASDPEGDALTYNWTVQSFYPVNPSLSTPDQPVTDVTGMQPGVYTVQVAVSDGVSTVTRTTTINVLKPREPGKKFALKGRYEVQP